MRKYCYLICFLIGIYTLNGQSTQQDILIQENYNTIAFESFAKILEEQYDIQSFYFGGWVKNITIQQSQAPARLEEILDATLASTSYRYFINKNRQLLLTAGLNINGNLTYQEASEATTANQAQVSQSISPSTQSALTDFESEWFVIGDPSAPEQEPKVRLSGYVRNEETQEPLEAAIVYIEELRNGVTTDSAGYYEFFIPQGRYQVIVQSVGLKEKSQKLQLYSSGQMDLQLGALVLNIEEITVRADKKKAIESVNMGVEALTTETIKELPTLFGEVDVVRSALMLPGVQTAGEFSAGINVRGGGADQNLVLLNGAPVFNASHLFGFSSAFSSDVVDGFELYKSSIPAKFGGRVSSVLEVGMKEGNQEKWSLSGGISPVTGRLTLEGPIIKDHTSVIISGRSTYADWILDQIEDASIRNSRANYADLTARVRTRLAQNDYLDISGYISNDDFKLNGDTTFAYQNRNLAVHYQKAFNDQLFGTFSGVYSQYQFNVESQEQPASAFDLSYLINYWEGKGHFSYAPADNHQVNFGISAINYQLDPGQIAPTDPESLVEPETLARENAIEASIYVSDDWTVSPSFSISAGLRFTQYYYLGPREVNEYRPDAARTENNIIGTTNYSSGELIQRYGGPEYRLSMRYILDPNNSFKAAFNRNRQYLSMLFNSATISPTATWKLADNHILPQTGDQFSIGYFRNMRNDEYEFSIEAYFKSIQDMLDYKAGADLLLNENLEAQLVNGQGQAYGLEVLLKKKGRRLNGWLSYTYSRSRFRSESTFLEDQINQNDWFNTNFDQPHDVSLVSFYKASKRFSISTNLTYSTGRPITIPVAKYNFGNGERLQYSRRNEFRVPDYFRWDLSINLDGNHKKSKFAHSSWSLSLYNVTGRQNVYSIYFVSNGEEAQGYQLSIFGRPFLTLTFNFKI